MSVQSSNKETSGDSDDDNDISESLLKEIINSAMPTSTNNDNMIPIHPDLFGTRTIPTKL